ncbi:gluconate 2-dehydrogenase subunit 3 family protein [Paraburkholderia sp. SIMBA_009]
MTEGRYPGYDVLAKRDTPSWDAPTRRVIDERMRTHDAARWLGPSAWRALVALCECIVPQQTNAQARIAAPAQNAEGATIVPVAALVDGKLLEDRRDGFRDSRLPPLREAWRIGLAALDAESDRRHRHPFADIKPQQQRDLLIMLQRGEFHGRAWEGMPADVFFAKRVLHDICSAFYSHPAAWSALGFGGPANPRGYVRLVADRRDPWEAVEARDDSESAKARARRANAHIGASRRHRAQP